MNHFTRQSIDSCSSGMEVIFFLQRSSTPQHRKIGWKHPSLFMHYAIGQ